MSNPSCQGVSMNEPLSTAPANTASVQRIINVAREIERLKGHLDLAGLLYWHGFREEPT